MDKLPALVIEDDAAVAEAYADALRLAGLEVEVVLDGQTALDRLATAVPRVVVLDMNLPFVSGADILRHVRADPRLDRTRVIVITGNAQSAATIEKDADLVLIKPVSQEQLTDFAERLRSDRSSGPAGPGAGGSHPPIPR